MTEEEAYEILRDVGAWPTGEDVRLNCAEVTDIMDVDCVLQEMELFPDPDGDIDRVNVEDFIQFGNILIKQIVPMFEPTDHYWRMEAIRKILKGK